MILCYSEGRKTITALSLTLIFILLVAIFFIFFCNSLALFKRFIEISLLSCLKGS